MRGVLLKRIVVSGARARARDRRRSEKKRRRDVVRVSPLARETETLLSFSSDTGKGRAASARPTRQVLPPLSIRELAFYTGCT